LAGVRPQTELGEAYSAPQTSCKGPYFQGDGRERGIKEGERKDGVRPSPYEDKRKLGASESG